MSKPCPEKVPKTQPAFAGGPPKPPKKTVRGLADGSSKEPYIDIPDPITLADLAAALSENPVFIVADLLKPGRVTTDLQASVDFEVASRVTLKHGFYASRIA